MYKSCRLPGDITQKRSGASLLQAPVSASVQPSNFAALFDIWLHIEDVASIVVMFMREMPFDDFDVSTRSYCLKSHKFI